MSDDALQPTWHTAGVIHADAVAACIPNRAQLSVPSVRLHGQLRLRRLLLQLEARCTCSGMCLRLPRFRWLAIHLDLPLPGAILHCSWRMCSKTRCAVAVVPLQLI